MPEEERERGIDSEWKKQMAVTFVVVTLSVLNNVFKEFWIILFELKKKNTLKQE